MRIVQFIDTLRSGGKERQLVELLKGLAQVDEVECELIVMSEQTHYTALYSLDIPVHRLVRKSQHDPGIFWRLHRLLKKIQPDILHSWSSMCSVYALPSVKLLNIRFVNAFLRNAPPHLDIRDKDWRRAKLTFPFSNAIVANSLAGLRAYKAPAKKSFCIHNGFDFCRIERLEKPAVIRACYGITTPYAIGMVATFSGNKDFFTFVDAAQNILKFRRDVTFLAVGDGPNRKLCQNLVQEGNRSLILFPGKIKDVESLVQVFDIGVLCSPKGEGISNTLMEYMALGKPVIATDCGGNGELVVEGQTGYLVNNKDVTELEKRISFLVDHIDRARALGLAGKQRISADFSLQAMTDAYLQLYTTLLKGK